MNKELETYAKRKAEELYAHEVRSDNIYNDDGDMYLSVPTEFFVEGFKCCYELLQKQNKKENNKKEWLRKQRKKAKTKLYEPKVWGLFENGLFVDEFISHRRAKDALFFARKDARRDCLDVEYEIKPIRQHKKLKMYL